LSSGRTLAIAGLLLALATGLGAFGAHALKGQLPAERLALWDTAVRYHFFQGLGLLCLGLVMRGAQAPALRGAAVLILVGTVLFSGSLYALALGVPRAVGVLTPLGGLLLIGGWLAFAYGMWTR
jgi:uncharacterized membrane protein YgdD (TMEM256/DUF423 family)